MIKKGLRGLALLGCVLVVTTAGLQLQAAKGNQKNVISEGIYIGNIEVGGMTKKKAKLALNTYVKNAKSETIKVKVDDQIVETTLGKLGYSCDVDYFIDSAFNYGKTGDIIKRYKEKKDLEQEDVVFDLAFSLNHDKVEKFVEKKCSVYDVEAQNARWKKKNGKMIVVKEKQGRVISVEDTTKKIEKTIAKQWIVGGITVKAIMNDAKPEYTSDLLVDCSDVLGDFSTSFASSDNARSQNLVNAAKLLNGHTIYPGETFSVASHLVPFTEENGYKVSKAYSSGQVVDSVGGGVCQAATTLYNALLEAEMEIVERYNHSMIVAYVKPSMDAAISDGCKDLKFKNNTENPIYLEAYTANRSIYFKIYGKETRDVENRKVTYESEVLEKIEPGEDKVIVDSSLPAGYETVTQSAHVGYKAKLWKIVTENGKQTSKEQVNYSYYAPEPRYITKGADKETPKPETTEDAKATKKPEKKDKTSSATKAPVVTKATKATKAPVHTQAPVVTQKAEEEENKTEEASETTQE